MDESEIHIADSPWLHAPAPLATAPVSVATVRRVDIIAPSSSHNTSQEPDMKLNINRRSTFRMLGLMIIITIAVGSQVFSLTSIQQQDRPTIGGSYKESKPAWELPTQAPKGAPNIIYLVLDDVGYAQLGCFGSEIQTPNIDRLAAGGLRYTNFHTTSLCSPSRSCLLTGDNHHSNHLGVITELSTGYPGYDGRMPRSQATIGEILR